MRWFHRSKPLEQRVRRKNLWWETAAELTPEDYDPLGSYTGAAADGSAPEQDADDL